MATPWLILKDLAEGGVTIHLLSEEFDAGDILLQARFDLSDQDDYTSVTAKIIATSETLMNTFLADPARYLRNPTPQGHGEYWPQPNLIDRTVNLRAGLHAIHKVVRAFSSCDFYAQFDDKMWAVQEATVWHIAHSCAPGKVVHRGATDVIVAARDGVVHLKNVRQVS